MRRHCFRCGNTVLPGHLYCAPCDRAAKEPIEAMIEAMIAGAPEVSRACDAKLEAWVERNRAQLESASVFKDAFERYMRELNSAEEPKP